MCIHCIWKRQNKLFIPPGKQLFPKWDRKPVLTLSKQSGSGKGSVGASGELVIWSGAQVPQDSKAAVGLLCLSLTLGGGGGKRQIQTETVPYGL